MSWKQLNEQLTSTVQGWLVANFGPDGPHREYWEQADDTLKEEVVAEYYSQALDEEEMRPLKVAMDRPLVRSIVDNKLLSEADKEELLDGWVSNFDPKADPSLMRRTYMNFKDSSLGIDGIGSGAGAVLNTLTASLTSLKAEEDIARQEQRIVNELEFRKTTPFQYDDKGNVMFRGSGQPDFRNKDDAVLQLDLERVRANKGKGIPHFKRSMGTLLERDAQYAAVPEWSGMLEGFAALSGQLFGALLSFENVVGGSAAGVKAVGARSLAKRFALSAGDNIFLNMATEPVVQYDAINRGIQEDVSFRDATLRAGLGVAVAVPTATLGHVVAGGRLRETVVLDPNAKVDIPTSSLPAELLPPASTATQAATPSTVSTQQVNVVVQPTNGMAPVALRPDGSEVYAPREGAAERQHGLDRQMEEAGVPMELRNEVGRTYAELSNVEANEAVDTIFTSRTVDDVEQDYFRGNVPKNLRTLIGFRLAEKRIEAGGDAADIFRTLTNDGLAQGQAIQLFSLFGKLSLPGALKNIQRNIDTAVRETIPNATAKALDEVDATKVKVDTAKVVQAAENTIKTMPVWDAYRAAAAEGIMRFLFPASRAAETPPLEQVSSAIRRALMKRLTPLNEKVTVKDADKYLRQLVDNINNPTRLKEMAKDVSDILEGAGHIDEAKRLRALDMVDEARSPLFTEPEMRLAVDEQLANAKIKLRDVAKDLNVDEPKLLDFLSDKIAQVFDVDLPDFKAAVRTQLGKQLKEQKDKILQQKLNIITRTLTKRQAKTMTDKVTELSKLGAMDDAKWQDLVAGALGLKTKLTPNDVAKVKELVGKMKAEQGNLMREQYHAAKLMYFVDEFRQKTFGEKLRHARLLSMLLNAPTIVTNLLGNTIFQPFQWGKDGLAATADMGYSLVTGAKRQKTMPNVGAWMSGWRQPIKEVKEGMAMARKYDPNVSTWDALKEGFDYLRIMSQLQASNKFDMQAVKDVAGYVFDSKVGRLLENTFTTVLGVPDRFFWWAAFRRDIAEQMGASRASGIDIVFPTPEMTRHAFLKANESIYQNDTVTNTFLRYTRKMLNLPTDAVGFKMGLGDLMIPFMRVPAALVELNARWSPLGFMRVMGHAVFNPNLTRKEFFEMFSEASIGSFGFTGAGAIGYAQGWITRPPPDENRDVQALQRYLGMGGYQLNVTAIKETLTTNNWGKRRPLQAGDVLMPMEWVVPAAYSLALGVELQAMRDDKQRLDAAALAAGVEMPKEGGTMRLMRMVSRTATNVFVEQPLFSSLYKFMASNTFTSPAEAIVNVMGDALSSFTPSQLNRLAQLENDSILETKGSNVFEQAWGKVAQRIPYLSAVSGFPVRKDIFGEDATRFGTNAYSAAEVLLSPILLKRVRDDPVALELLRLWEDTRNTAVVPNVVAKTVDVNGVQFPLSNEQIAHYQQFVGRYVGEMYKAKMFSPVYHRLSNEGRIKLLGDDIKHASLAYKMYFLGHKQSNPPKEVARVLSIMMEDVKAADPDGNNARRFAENLKEAQQPKDPSRYLAQ
jgi:hypothetical protein